MKTIDQVKESLKAKFEDGIETQFKEAVMTAAQMQEQAVKRSLQFAAAQRFVRKNRRVVGRVAIVNRVRNGKVQMLKKEPTTKGYKIQNGQIVKMNYIEMRRRKIGARIASRKRRLKQTTINRKRALSMRLRHTRLR